MFLLPRVLPHFHRHRRAGLGRYKGYGVRRRCAGTGQAGWFFRVLTPGTLSAGDTLRLLKRPNPTWTLWGVCDLLYSTETDYPVCYLPCLIDSRPTKPLNVEPVEPVEPSQPRIHQLGRFVTAAAVV